LLRAVSQEIRLPAFAIGGITRDNLSAVQAAGGGRIAVGGAVNDATDPHSAALGFLTLLGNGFPPVTKI
jgi:thiamine monophosphate synthase